MDLLISWETYETEFKGEKVSMELLPLKVDAYAKLAPYLKKYGTDEREAATRNALELQAASTEILAAYVRSIKGITINSEPPTPEILSSDIRLTGLVMDIVQTLIMRALMDEEKEKNLDLPSGSSLMDEPAI